MRIDWISVLAAAAGLLLGADGARAGDLSLTTIGHRVEDCSDLRFSFDGRRAATAEERFTIPSSAALGFRVRLPENGGVSVRGADRDDFAVTLCKAAATSEGLRGVSAWAAGGEVLLRGPAGEEWFAYLLVSAPRNAAIDLEASNGPTDLAELSGALNVRSNNGPISIEECSGRVEARADNGPISISASSGEGQAQAENGPIDFEGNRGRFRLSTVNGPIGVELTGTRWEEGELEARAVNGPLSLRIPEGFRSGAVVEASGHAPMRCRAAACAGARKGWDEGARRVEIGESPVVRMSTVNGPVSIETPAEDEED